MIYVFKACMVLAKVVGSTNSSMFRISIPQSNPNLIIPPDIYSRDGFNMMQNCYINFDENILISCEEGLTLIDRLSNFLFSE
jgi:hypothetical protein